MTLTTNTPDKLPIGATKIIVKARDAAGNQSQKTVTLTVLEPGKKAPKPDFTPPGPVRALAAKPVDGAVLLTWTAPAASDLAYVRIERSIVGGPGSSTKIVYRGLGTSFKSTGLRNGVTYRFILVAFDKSNNSSKGVVVSASPKALLLAAPKPGAKVTKAPAPALGRCRLCVLLQRPAVPEGNEDPLGLAEGRPPQAHLALVVREAQVHAQAGRLHVVRVAGCRPQSERALRRPARQEQLRRRRDQEPPSEEDVAATGRSRARSEPAGASSRPSASARGRGGRPSRQRGRRG